MSNGAMSSPPPLTRGQTVAVRWGDGTMYIGTLLSAVPDGGFVVEFQDGSDPAVMETADLVAAPPATHPFAVGARVLALWQAGKMFPGTITARVQSGAYRVAWDDGDAPLDVPAGKLVPLEWVMHLLPPDLLPRGAGPWMNVTQQVIGPSGTGADTAKGKPPPLPAAAAPGRTMPPPLPGATRQPTSSAQQAGERLRVFIPGQIMPVERGTRFVEPLDDALRPGGLGKVTDEGTELREVNGRPAVSGCHLEVTVQDVARALATVREVLRRAGAPPETTITHHGATPTTYRL